ncbi:MAG: DUF4422 domain-containing protein [Lachnospiraceae bacterium]|nr:DUF4422 domain-containing protein [Lachnospiraceae bacterium]
MKNVKVFISCHKPSDVLKDEVFAPIQVGSSAEGHSLIPEILHDNEGDNISSLNPSYCELTAQYWAWKNLKLDYYGFCHYRRYFNLSGTKFPEDSYGNIIEPYLTEDAADRYCLHGEDVRRLTEQYDVVVTERKDLRKMPGRYSTPAQQFAAAPFLHGEDYRLMLDIIDERYPEYSRAAHQFSDGHFASFCNMFIMRADLFDQYCSWMFGVLEEFCRRRDMRMYSIEALRTPGHLSERLLNIFLLHLQETRSDVRIKEVQCVLIQHTEPQACIQPLPGRERCIPVVFAADNGFVPIFSACLQSLLDHCSRENFYDLVLISKDLSDANRRILTGMLNGYENVSLRFYNPGKILSHYQLKANAHITQETYYRFLIQEIMPAYEKVLYLDCDLIICEDVAQLYAVNVDGYMLGAVRDADFLGQIGGADPNAHSYIENEFHMKNPAGYFQAGVLLFNEKEMRAAYTLEQWLSFASHPYRFNDQDILNLHCEGRVLYLDMAWNLIHDMNHKRVAQVIAYAPADVQNAYRKAHSHPKIIHYAGGIKPWKVPTEDLADYFWAAMRRTPYYEVVLSACAEGRQGSGGSLYKKFSSAVIKLFPVSTRRRAFLDRIYIALIRK